LALVKYNFTGKKKPPKGGFIIWFCEERIFSELLERKQQRLKVPQTHLDQKRAL
jgi:hypothetical protein